MKNKELAAKQMLAGAFLQRVLAEELDLPAGIIRFRYGEHGKPMLSDGTLAALGTAIRADCFNLSHSGDYAVAAFSDGAVGIDVERVRKNQTAVARRCFCRREYEDILAAGDGLARQRLFVKYWTMKEAYIKRSGEGLQKPLDSFCILRGEGGLSEVEGEAVYFRTYELAEGYHVSICSAEKQDLEQVEEPREIRMEHLF